MDHSRTKRTRIATAAAGLALGGGLLVAPTMFGGDAASAADPPWQTVRLQPLAEGEATHVSQISNAGVSVGQSGTKPVRWTDAGVPTALQLPAGCTSGEATTVTAQGVAAGYADCGSGVKDHTGVIWGADGAATKLEAPLGIHDLSNTRFMVGQRNPDSDVTDQAFAYVQGQPRLDLPASGADSSEANALTEYGFVVGTLRGVPTLPSSVAVGWYGSSTFPLVRLPVATEGIDATEAAYSLVQIRGTSNDRPVVVTPQGGLVNLNSEGAEDTGVDLTENGFTLGFRKPAADSSSTDGLVNLGNGSTVRLDSLAAPADVETYGFDRPAAMNDGAEMVGNHGDVSWLLKPPAPATTTTSTSSSTSSTSTTATTVPSSPTVTAGE